MGAAEEEKRGGKKWQLVVVMDVCHLRERQPAMVAARSMQSRKLPTMRHGSGKSKRRSSTTKSIASAGALLRRRTARGRGDVLDNLAKDAALALAANMSYGRWKAEHPHTNLECVEVKTEKPEKICLVCGVELAAGRRKYCSRKCSNVGSNQMRRNRRARRGA